MAFNFNNPNIDPLLQEAIRKYLANNLANNYVSGLIPKEQKSKKDPNPEDLIPEQVDQAELENNP